MSKKIFVSYLLVVSFFVFVSQTGAGFRNDTSVTGSNYIQFPFGSVKLSQKSRTQLLAKASDLQLIKGKSEEFTIELVSYYCEKEANLDPFIGVKRAKCIQDTLAKYSKLPLEKFLIRDPSAYKSTKASKDTCDVSAVLISLTRICNP